MNHRRYEGKTREEVWAKWEKQGYGNIPKRIDYSAVPLHQFVERVSELVGGMEWIESKRCEGWPPEFQDKFSDQLSMLNYIDEFLRMKEWMPPRLGKKPFKQFAPNSFRSVERITFKKSDHPRVLQMLADCRRDMEEIEKETYDDDEPQKHQTHNRKLSILIELEKRFTAIIEGK